MEDGRTGAGGTREERSGAPPSPAAALPGLDDQQLGVLRQIGRAWQEVADTPEAWRRALPVDPDQGTFPPASQVRPTGLFRHVRVAGMGGTGAETLRRAELPPTGPGRLGYRARRLLLGAPLRSTALVRERMRKLLALPVLSADALSSVAYGPEAMLAVLILAGTVGLSYSLPIAATIALMMLTVGLAYRQTIRAYPHGGGAYTVAGDNLGRRPGLVAAAGLMTDYILTVAVSVSAGTAAVTSVVPALAPASVPLGVGVIALLLAGNLRGIRQAGALFALPTYAFVVAMFALIGAGVVDAAGQGFSPTQAPRPPVVESVGVLLVMRAFASGSTAMTGVEAISNAVPVFQPVEWRNARTTLTWMIGILVVLFSGLVVLIHFNGVTPTPHQTVLSQLARGTFGSGWMYVFVQASTAAVLLLAANTAFNDFPRVLSLLARDRYAPKTFLRMGDRLAYSNGIILLSTAAVIIYVVFNGDTTSLIPVYAVGVFLAFTLSQTGMVVHWWRRRTDRWRRSLTVNAAGAVLSAVVLVTAAVTKFTAGAWVAMLTVGLLVLVATRIRRHYKAVDTALRLHPHAIELPRDATPASVRPTVSGAERGQPRKGAHAVRPVFPQPRGEEKEETPEEIHHLTVVPVETMHLASMRALAYAASLQQPVLALHVSPTDAEAQRFRGYWTQWGGHLPLEVVVSPYRVIIAPLVNYIEALHRQRPDLTLTIILPEIVVRHWRHRFLHGHTAARLRRAFRPLAKVVVTTVPFHV